MELGPGVRQKDAAVPENWEVMPLSSLTSLPVQNGVFCEPNRKGRGLRLINVGDLYAFSPIKIDSLEQFDATPAEVARFQVLRGDIFFTRSSLTPDGIAHCNVYDEDHGEPVVFDCHIIRARPNPRRVDPLFLFRYCLTSAARRHLVVNAKTTTMTTIDQSVINTLPVPVPPLGEQRAIAEALSDVDALLRGLDQLIAKKRDLGQAAMQRLLTGQTRLPSFRGKWETKRLGEVAHIKTGSRNNEDKVEDGAYPLFVRSQIVERINRYSYDCEAILVPGEGGIGSIFHYINGKFDCHQRVYKISAFDNSVIGQFVFYVMKHTFHRQATRNSVKATVDSLRLPTFQKFEFLAPPPEEQRAIVAALSDIEEEVALLERRSGKTRALKQGMMQELLTGRTRLL